MGSARSCDGVPQYRSSHWFYDQNISNVPITSILYTIQVAGTLAVPGFGAHHRLGLFAEVVGRNKVRWSADRLSNESVLPRWTDSTCRWYCMDDFTPIC